MSTSKEVKVTERSQRLAKRQQRSRSPVEGEPAPAESKDSNLVPASTTATTAAVASAAAVAPSQPAPSSGLSDEDLARLWQMMDSRMTSCVDQACSDILSAQEEGQKRQQAQIDLIQGGLAQLQLHTSEASAPRRLTLRAWWEAPGDYPDGVDCAVRLQANDDRYPLLLADGRSCCKLGGVSFRLQAVLHKYGGEAIATVVAEYDEGDKSRLRCVSLEPIGDVEHDDWFDQAVLPPPSSRTSAPSPPPRRRSSPNKGYSRPLAQHSARDDVDADRGTNSDDGSDDAVSVTPSMAAAGRVTITSDHLERTEGMQAPEIIRLVVEWRSDSIDTSTTEALLAMAALIEDTGLEWYLLLPVRSPTAEQRKAFLHMLFTARVAANEHTQSAKRKGNLKADLDRVLTRYSPLTSEQLDGTCETFTQSFTPVTSVLSSVNDVLVAARRVWDATSWAILMSIILDAEAVKYMTERGGMTDQIGHYAEVFLARQDSEASRSSECIKEEKYWVPATNEQGHRFLGKVQGRVESVLVKDFAGASGIYNHVVAWEGLFNPQSVVYVRLFSVLGLGRLSLESLIATESRRDDVLHLWSPELYEVYTPYDVATRTGWSRDEAAWQALCRIVNLAVHWAAVQRTKQHTRYAKQPLLKANMSELSPVAPVATPSNPSSDRKQQNSKHKKRSAAPQRPRSSTGATPTGSGSEDSPSMAQLQSRRAATLQAKALVTNVLVGDAQRYGEEHHCTDGDGGLQVDNVADVIAGRMGYDLADVQQQSSYLALLGDVLQVYAVSRSNVCFFCGKQGHFWMRCRSAARGDKRSEEGKRAYEEFRQRNPNASNVLKKDLFNPRTLKKNNAAVHNVMLVAAQQDS